MIFDLPNYYNSLDRGYDFPENKERPMQGLEVRNIGISSNPMQNQLDGLKARIFQGASAVELGFSGTGKGSMGGQSTTPEMYGADERQDMAELAKLNKIKLSTHASFRIGPLSGMTQQGFDNNAREATLREIERAIDFAADVAKGGAVVVHTGEFPRPLTEKFPDQNFKMFAKESEEAVMHLVDSQTGQIIQSVKKNQPVVMPVWKGESYKDGQIDLSGVKPEQAGLWPEPEFDMENGKFVVKERNWQDLEKIRDWYNKNIYPEEVREAKEKGEPIPKRISTEQVAYRATLESRKQYAEGWAKDYGERYRQARESRELLQNIQSKIPSVGNKYNLTHEEETLLGRMMDIDGFAQQKTEVKQQIIRANASNLSKSVENNINNNDRMMSSYREASLSQFQQAEEYKRMEQRAIPIEDFARDRTADTIARAAEFAHRKSVMLKERGQLESPIYVAPENIFPETYGAHPEELKAIIIQARQKYVEEYGKQYGQAEAKKIADEHIRATFDIGHAYTWRKYFDDSKYSDPKKADEAFHDWLMKQVDDLNKGGYIGHVHVSDNFGWEDEHVTPGQGRVPIKEFVDKMKAAGIKEVTVEPAHQDYRAMLGGWREFGAPIYGAAPPATTARGWTDIEHSYFGQTRSPYFIFGEYAPSQDFTLWTQVPLE